MYSRIHLNNCGHTFQCKLLKRNLKTQLHSSTREKTHDNLNIIDLKEYNHKKIFDRTVAFII